jgi:hypothetical protein
MDSWTCSNASGSLGEEDEGGTVPRVQSQSVMVPGGYSLPCLVITSDAVHPATPV